MPMTSFPTFMNGAYSHELRQINLQECTKLLEGHIIKLTMENNALRMAFQCLAGAIGLCDMDPCQFDGKSLTQISTLLKLKAEPAPPAPNWDKYLELPEGQMSNQGTMGYLEDKDGNPPSCKTEKAICKVLCGGWVELLIHGLMEKAFPDFKFTNNGWKVDYLASMTYPAWQKGMLDDNAHDGKTPSLFAGALCNHEKKTIQHDTIMTTSVISIDPLTTLTLAASKVQDILLLNTTQELRSNLIDPDNVTSNAMSVLKLESAVLPAVTLALSMIPTVVNNTASASVNKSAKGSGKAKMCPGPAKNGHNLCAHCWCKQAQSSGSTEEFQKYYNGLTFAQ
ncbi:hypothetical protein EDD16DRAFT_1770806 [Pisolithus croceorrhizus]|nr:hypothetical protein EDD16DRAFT_1770806 [Pisolithus croceorrhizus]